MIDQSLTSGPGKGILYCIDRNCSADGNEIHSDREITYVPHLYPFNMMMKWRHSELFNTHHLTEEYTRDETIHLSPN